MFLETLSGREQWSRVRSPDTLSIAQWLDHIELTYHYVITCAIPEVLTTPSFFKMAVVGRAIE